MVLEAVRRQAQESIDQSIVSHDGQHACSSSRAYALIISGVASGMPIVAKLEFGTMRFNFTNTNAYFAWPTPSMIHSMPFGWVHLSSLAYELARPNARTITSSEWFSSGNASASGRSPSASLQ